MDDLKKCDEKGVLIGGAAHGVWDGRTQRKNGGFHRCIIIQAFGSGHQGQRVYPT